MKKFLKVLSIIFAVLLVVILLVFLVAYIFFKPQLEELLGKTVGEFITAISVSVVGVTGGLSLSFKKISDSLVQITGTNTTASESFDKAAKTFDKASEDISVFKNDLTEIISDCDGLRGELQQAKIELEETKNELKKTLKAFAILSCKDKSMVSDGTAIEVCALLDEKKEADNENGAN